MSWDEYVCLGKAEGCEGYRGAPCDCFEPYTWSDAEKQESRGLLDQILADCQRRFGDPEVSAATTTTGEPDGR